MKVTIYSYWQFIFFLVLFSAWIYHFFQELGVLNALLINSFYNDQYKSCKDIDALKYNLNFNLCTRFQNLYLNEIIEYHGCNWFTLQTKSLKKLSPKMTVSIAILLPYKST